MATRSGPLSALVLALLMVTTVLTGVPPQAEAQSTPNPTLGCMQISAYPEFGFNAGTREPAEIFAKPGSRPEDLYKRVVRVTNNCGAPMDEIRFLFYIDPQGCNIPPPPAEAINPCFRDASVFWLADHSSAPGWNVSVENPVAPEGVTGLTRQLIFKSAPYNPVIPPGGQASYNSTLLPGGHHQNPSSLARGQDFTIAFTLRGGDAGGPLSIPIQLIGFKAVYPSSPDPPTPFETTCAASPNNNWRCILPTDSVQSPNPDQSPSLRIVMDGSRPVVHDDGNGNFDVQTRDVDQNGHIDRILVRFGQADQNGISLVGERLDPAYFDPSLFTIKTRVRELYSKPSATACTLNYKEANACWHQYQIIGAFLTDSTQGGVGVRTQATFLVKEQPFYDTGDTPIVQYRAPPGSNECKPQDSVAICGVRDLAGNAMRGQTGNGIVARDGAKPVMVGAWGRVGSDKIDIFFSEPVIPDVPAGTADCVGAPACSASVLTTSGTNFIAEGIEIGMTLVITSGSAAGSYTITSVAANSLAFEPASTTGSVAAGNTFTFGEDLNLAQLTVIDGGPVDNPPWLPSDCNVLQGKPQLQPAMELRGVATDARNLPAAGTHWRLQTSSNPDDGNRPFRLAACDVHPLTGDMLGVTVRAGQAANQGCVAEVQEVPPCNAVILDMAGLHLSYHMGSDPTVPSGSWANKTWPSGGVEVRPHGSLRHITYPLVEQVDVDVQSELAPDCIDNVCQPRVPDQTLRVKFNGPVFRPYTSSGDCATKACAVTHSEMDIASESGVGQGPQGFIGDIFTFGGVDTLLVKMDHPARPTDVDNTPSFFKIHCNRIQGYGLTGGGTAVGASAFVPCDDPDRYYGWDEDPTGIVLERHRDVAVVDVTAPRVTRATTVDSNRDGYIDGIEFTFSEPVNDATFCGSNARVPDFCPDQDGFGLFNFHSPWSPNKDSRETNSVVRCVFRPTPPCTEGNGGFRWDTGLVQNDNKGIVQLVSATLDAETQAWVFRTRNFQTNYGPLAAQRVGDVMDRRLLPSDYVPTLTLAQPTLFDDTALQPTSLLPANRVPAFCQPYHIQAWQGLSATTNWSGPNLCDIHVSQCAPPWQSQANRCPMKYPPILRIHDGAPPVIWKADTVDTPFYNSAHEHSRTPNRNTRDPIVNGNGTIDGYRITFSEPVIDSSFCAQQWTLEGFDERTGIHAITGMRTYDPLDANVGRRFNDDQFTIQFNETVRLTAGGQVRLSPLTGLPIPVPNTDARPQLTYDPAACGGRGIQDHVRNTMLPYDEFGITEQDNAAPTIVSAEGFAGRDILIVTFSEPVDDGSRSPLVRDDFNYYDENRGGVASKSSTKEVCHGDGDAISPIPGCTADALSKAVVPLSGPLTPGDIANDKLAAVSNTIYERAPSVLGPLRKAVNQQKMPLGYAPDSTQPGPITNLRVETDLVDAGSVTLSWTAPGSDGAGGGPVLAYEFRVSESPNVSFNDVNPTGVSAFPRWDREPPVGPGLTQTLKVVGLKPDTTYYFIVRAVDTGEEPGPQSSTVQARTTRDSSPPTGGPLRITSDCEPQPVQRVTCQFQWNALSDPESPFSLRYKYKHSSQREDRVLSTDAETENRTVEYVFPGNGTWYFHVAGFSGGGATETFSYRVVVGAATIDDATLRELNDKVDVQPVRYVRDDVYVNEVRWTLPPEEELDGARLIAVEIWRKTGEEILFLERIPGSYQQLQTGVWEDNKQGVSERATYRVIMVFAGTPEQQELEPTRDSRFSELSDETPEPIPGWAYLLIGVGLALLVAGIVIFFVLRSKQAERAGSTPYAWESANPDQIGIDEATGMPVHEVRCPSCNNPFQAVGNLPLPVTCPNCGTTGTLD